MVTLHEITNAVTHLRNYNGCKVQFFFTCSASPTAKYRILCTTARNNTIKYRNIIIASQMMRFLHGILNYCIFSSPSLFASVVDGNFAQLRCCIDVIHVPEGLHNIVDRNQSLVSLLLSFALQRRRMIRVRINVQGSNNMIQCENSEKQRNHNLGATVLSPQSASFKRRYLEWLDLIQIE